MGLPADRSALCPSMVSRPILGVVALTRIRIMILCIGIIYVVAGQEIFKKHRALRDFSSSDNGTNQRRSAAAEISFKTTEVQVSTELADLNSPNTLGQNTPRSGGGQPPRYEQYNVTIGRGDVDVEAVSAEKSLSHLSKPQTHAIKNRNNAAWAYTKAAVLFFVALLITWVYRNQPQSKCTS
jgi:hypothetical protein